MDWHGLKINELPFVHVLPREEFYQFLTKILSGENLLMYSKYNL